jgi:hypothetical protein
MPIVAPCPRCGAVATMLPIVFGYPSAQTFAAAERGQVALGGCMVMGEDPTHRCMACAQDVILDSDAPETCASCGGELGDDPEADSSDPAGPICGECNRARNFDADEEVAWAEE